MNAVIAVNPQQMQEAQATTTGWVETKLKDAKSDLVAAEQTFNSLHKNGLRTQPAATLIKKANRRIRFYEKVKAALEAGYYIIPPFDIQVFAIRTDRVYSPNQRGTDYWPKDQTPRALPVGVGDYRNPVVTRSVIERKTETNKDGTSREVKIYQNDNWQDGIDLPVRAMKPQVIEATGKALASKIFDALGIAPAYCSADPIIAGQINRPDGKGALTFFVAWWLDESDL